LIRHVEYRESTGTRVRRSQGLLPARRACAERDLRDALRLHPDPDAETAVDDPNLVLDAVKRAEDPDALLLRLYEAHGARGTARVRLGVPFSSARRTNALEDDGDPLEVEGDKIVIA
jgi:alpha-mannosidase